MKTLKQARGDILSALSRLAHDAASASELTQRTEDWPRLLDAIDLVTDSADQLGAAIMEHDAIVEYRQCENT